MSHTLLIAEENPDLIELGFKDSVNYIVADKTNFYGKGLYYLKNEKKRAEIAMAGYKFIHKNHTHQIRAQQICKLCGRMYQTIKHI